MSAGWAPEGHRLVEAAPEDQQSTEDLGRLFQGYSAPGGHRTVVAAQGV